MKLILALAVFTLTNCGVPLAAVGQLIVLQADESPGSETLVIPFDFTNQFLFVNLQESKLGNLRLLVDTGFEHTTMSGDTVALEGLSTHQRSHSTGAKAVGNGHPVKVTGDLPVSLEYSGMQLLSGRADVLDLENMAKSIQAPLNGVLGWDFFQGWCVRLDYVARQMTLTVPSECAAPTGPHGTLVGQWLKQAFLISAKLTFENEKNAGALLTLDSGNNGTLFLDSRYLKTAGAPSASHGKNAAQGGGVNGPFEGAVVQFREVNLDNGRLIFHGPDFPGVIGNPGSLTHSHWWLNGPSEAKISRDGLVGNGLLCHLILTFDPVRKRIYTESATDRKTENPSRP